MVKTWTRLALVAKAVLVLLTGPASAQPTEDLTERSAREFSNDVLVPALVEGRIPGALFAVVYRGEVLVADGFGLAHAPTARKADAQTLFRVGSLSKLVTATMLARLVDRGDLDLTADTRKLLAPAEFGGEFDQPITPVHLLTHTSGLDVSDIGDAGYWQPEVVSLETFIDRQMVDQMTPPGEFFRYTNHGYVLAGRLAEVTTKRVFAEAADELVFGPLAMTSSSFAQPPPKALKERLAFGHKDLGDTYQALRLDYSQVAPADALVTTAPDMAKFMLAHLEPSEFLSDEARAEMHRTHFTYDEHFGGRALGFAEERAGQHRGEYGRRRYLSHTGGQLGFTSEMLLYPEERLGLFIVLNRRDWAVRWNVFDAFMAKFFPTQRAEPSYATGITDLATEAVEKVPVPGSTFEGIGTMLEPDRIEVTVDNDEMVLARSDATTTLRPLSNDAFLSDDHKTEVVLRRRDGGLDAIIIDGEHYRPTPVWRSGGFHTLTLLGSTLVFLFGTPLWPLARWWRRRKHEESTGEAWAGRLATAQAAAHAGYVLLFVTALALVISSGGGFDYGVPPLMSLALVVPWLLVVVDVCAAVFAVLAVAKRYWGVALRFGLGFQVLLSAAVLAVVFSRSLTSS